MSCSEMEDLFNSGDIKNAVEISGIEAIVYGSEKTRAAALDKENYVGRSVFIHNDQMVLTTIKRTPQPSASPEVTPIPGFSYSDIVYNHEVEEGQTAGGWNRVDTCGRTEASEQVPERIYWSDASNYHTYIGYSLPQQTGGATFDWKMKLSYPSTPGKGVDTYYGSIGNPADGNDIDYTNDLEDDVPVPEIGSNGKETGAVSYKSGNEKIKRDDLLLTYDDEKLAEPGGSVAKLYYHHALANVRVVVNISGFSATSESADARSIVENMVLKDMLTMYKWTQMSNGAEALNATYDAGNISEIYGSGVTCDQKKDVHMWIPRTAGTGTGVSKQFVFYALAVPTTMAAGELKMQFNVKYQNPMDPWTDANKTVPNMQTHTYTATMPQKILFRAGWCTTINISLNHSNETMTVGAEYMDWEFDPSPDEGELKKNSTLLQGIDRSRVTIFGDIGEGEGVTANADDATWLYVDPLQNNQLRDIYGNDGSAAHPFIISTEAQLLSFAYEVKGTNRSQVTYRNIVSNSDVTIPANGAFDFSGYHIKLDADITMQQSITSESDFLEWIGIGDATHPFNGYFNGAFRQINRLYGSPLFVKIGEHGIIDHVYMLDALGIKGTGSIAEENNGIICGAYIEGDIVETTHSEYCGSIVGVNNGVLIACSHIGSITGNANVLGALLGKNNGIVVTCYNVGDATNNATGKPAYAGIGAFTPRSVAYCCYFNKDFYTSQDYDDLKNKGTIGHVAFPLTTAEMQSNKFVNQAYPNEITDARTKDDMFYWHWSLNTGLTRAIAYLSQCLTDQSGKDEIEFHAPGTSDTATGVERVKLPKSQVQWLVNHFVGGSHQFQFVPASYPKLK